MNSEGKSFRGKSKLKQTLLCVIFIFLFAFPKTSFPQDKYGFDFDKNFEWYDLLLCDNTKISPLLTSYVRSLMDEFTIEDGRNFFRELTKLDSITEIKNISQIAALDSDTIPGNWKVLLDSSLVSFSEPDNFSGLINAAYLLSKFHLKEGFSGNNFKKVKYEPNITPSHSLDIKLEFEPYPAYYTLEMLGKDSLTPDDLMVIDTSLIFRSFCDSTINPGMNTEKLIGLIKYSQQKKPLFKIYKIINPGCFRNLGGVSLYTKDFGEVLNTIQEKEINLKTAALYLLSTYLPAGTSFYTKAYLAFGNFIDTVINEPNNFIIRLENVADDYERFSRLTARGIFKVIWDDIEIDINSYLVKKEDSLFLSVIDNIYYSSCINYIATQFKEDRPSSMLEKDFAFFNKTISTIEKKNKKSVIDSLVHTGFSGQAPYFTMGMQIANYIDRFSGKEKLRNSIMLGTVYFFNSYIETYRQDTKQIKEVFRFNDYFEKKVSEWSSSSNYEVEQDLLGIQKYHSDTAKFFSEIRKLNDKYRSNLFIYNLMTGEMLSKFEYYSLALGYLKRSQPYIPNQDAIKRKISGLEELIQNNR
ncbi:MAG TPA: DUF5700 domain-containing putative Zn-dependent protease [Ignavibacteria bacterium]